MGASYKMNFDEMWELYDEVDEKHKPKIEDLIMSIADIYLSGLFAGTELVEKNESCIVFCLFHCMRRNGKNRCF